LGNSKKEDWGWNLVTLLKILRAMMRERERFRS